MFVGMPKKATRGFAGSRQRFVRSRTQIDTDDLELCPCMPDRFNTRFPRIGTLDAVRVSAGVARSFEAGPGGLQVLIFGPHVESDAEMVHDFWGE